MFLASLNTRLFVDEIRSDILRVAPFQLYGSPCSSEPVTEVLHTIVRQYVRNVDS